MIAGAKRNFAEYREGPDVGEEGVDLSQVDTSADNPITAGPPVTPEPLLPPVETRKPWNKAPGSGIERRFQQMWKTVFFATTRLYKQGPI